MINILTKQEHKFMNIKKILLSFFGVILLSVSAVQVQASGWSLGFKVDQHSLDTGASDDIEKITRLVKEWFQSWGMDDHSGPLNYSILNDVVDKELMTQRMTQFIKKWETMTMQVLSDNLNNIKKIANLLLEKETIDYQDIVSVLDNDLENSICSNKLTT